MRYEGRYEMDAEEMHGKFDAAKERHMDEAYDQWLELREVGATKESFDDWYSGRVPDEEEG
jgi:hypothetical protein